MNIRITRAKVIVAAALAAAAGGWFLVDWLIVTDRERVERTVDDLARAVERNDAEALAPLLDAEFRLGGMDPARFVAWYAVLLRAARVTEVSVRERSARIDARDRNFAVATATTRVTFERPAQVWTLEWQLEFRRRSPNEWKLESVRAYQPVTRAEIPLQQAAEWLRRIGETP